MGFPSRRAARLLAVALFWLLPAVAAAQPAPAPDSLKVTICGSSGPLPVRDRAKPCVAIQAAGSLYLVDIGPEATENLQLWRMPLATIRAVFVTHLHSDHIGDLGEFNMQSWVAGRPEPLTVAGPPGVGKLVEGFNEAYAFDHDYRRAHHEHDGVKLPLATGLMKAQFITTPAKPDAASVRRLVVWRKDGLVVTAILVAHDPASPAYAYRFDYKGRSVVISGDTRKWPPLAEAAKGADLMLHEAQNSEMTRTVSNALTAGGNPRMGSIMSDTLTYHTTPVEAAEIAKAAGVRALVLYHLTQAGLPFFTPQAFTKGIEEVGFPDWRLAKDGMTIELPVGNQDIKFGQN